MLYGNCTLAYPAVLTNDHKAVTSFIEQLMHELHAEVRTAQQVSGMQPARNMPPSTNAAQAAASNAAHSSHLPFAVVDEISSSSPAEEAGINLGDQLISFADITKQTSNTLPAVATALQVCWQQFTASFDSSDNVGSVVLSP